MEVFLSSHLPLKTEECSKCDQIIAEEKELIKIVHKS
jgi:hypothetical protein